MNPMTVGDAAGLVVCVVAALLFSELLRRR